MATVIKVGSLKLELLGGYLSGELRLAQFTSVIKGRSPKVFVELEPVYGDPDDPKSPPEIHRVARIGLEWLLANEAAAAKAVIRVIRAIRAKHPEVGAKPKDHIELLGVTFHEVESGRLPYLGFDFGCTWDEEHGLGLMTHGTRIVRVGGSDTAILPWIAKADAKKRKKPTKKKPKKKPKKSKR
jgi:hypothetical protein